jgi:DNA-binding NarL/FixJ family response regulator
MSRVFVLADVRLYRESLANVLAASGRVEVTGSAAVTMDAELQIRALRPDVVLVDMSAPDAHGVARHLHERLPDLALIALGVANTDHEQMRCAEVGIIGYVTSDATAPELMSVIDRAARGEVVCSPKMAGDLVRKLAAMTRDHQPRVQHAPLTKREREIAALVGQDLSNKEIAAKLNIEVATVKNHVHNVLDKLGITRRADIATALRRRHGFAAEVSHVNHAFTRG